MQGVPVAIVPTVPNVPDVPTVPNVTSVPIVPNSFSYPPEQGKRAGRDRHNGRGGLCGAAAFTQHLRSVSAAYALRIPGVWLVCSTIRKDALPGLLRDGFPYAAQQFADARRGEDIHLFQTGRPFAEGCHVRPFHHLHALSAHFFQIGGLL